MTMTRTVYLNGEYLPETEAKVSVFDRGFLMADGVYEVTSVLDGKLIDFAGHCARLARSLSELDMKNPHSDAEWLAIHRELVAQNDISEGMVYLQVTRGNPGDRDFAFPPAGDRADRGAVHPIQARPRRQSGGEDRLKVISIPDLRWGAARHQDGAASVSVDGQDGGQEGRRR
jgi:D-alanine transaminase